MRPELSRLLTLGLVIALLLAGCGGSEQIPARTASVITAGLERVDKRVRAGECDGARRTLETLDGRVHELPRRVDPAVRRTLSGGVDHLGTLVRKQCKQKPKPKPVEEPVVEPATPEPPVITQPEQPQIEEPEKPRIEKPRIEKPQKPQVEKPEKPQVEKPTEPTEEEQDTCGENPSAQC